jgi:RNA polymerase sigma-70 factor, ECF subfamily
MDHDAIHAEHQRIVQGDPAAPGRLVDLLLEPLAAFVQKAVPTIIDPHLVEECCLDALLDYLRAPEHFDHEKARLFTWIAGHARWNALTKLRNETRRSRREKIVMDRIRDEQRAVDKSPEGMAMDVIVVRQVLDRHSDALLEEDGDLEVFLLIAAGAHEAEHYLDALGLDDTPANRMIVNTRRERIRSRIRRLNKNFSHE